MKLARRWDGVSTAVIAVLLATAGTNFAAEEADREALRKIRGLYEEVVKSDDLSSLMPYLPPNLTAVTPTAEEVKGPKELEAYFKRIWELIGKGGSYQVKVNVGSTDLYRDIAVSHGTTDEYVRTAAGKEYKFPMFWTAVSRKIAGKWQVIRMHGSIDPLSNPFVKSELNATRWIFGLGGLILGLVAGYLLRFIRRSPA